MADPSRHHANPHDLSAQDRIAHRSVYRDETSVLAGRRAALQRDYQRQVTELPRDLIAAYARRVARIWFGVVAAAGGVAMFGVAVYQSALGLFPSPRGGATWTLLATWAAALLTYAVARKLAARKLHAEIARVAAPSDDLHTDITRLQIYTPVKRTVSLIDRKERASVAWPLIGLAFIGPLSLHGVVALLLQVSAADFAVWILLSGILVGHCHVIVIVFAVLFARQVGRIPLDVPILAFAPWTKVFWVIGAALIPFVLPALFVAITALVYFPLAYRWIAGAVTRERVSLLEAAGMQYLGVI
jgi:hypothetical protein